MTRYNSSQKDSLATLSLIGDMHDDVSWATPTLVSLNHLSHTKCVGFADLQVDFLIQNLNRAMKF